MLLSLPNELLLQIVDFIDLKTLNKSFRFVGKRAIQLQNRADRRIKKHVLKTFCEFLLIAVKEDFMLSMFIQDFMLNFSHVIIGGSISYLIMKQFTSGRPESILWHEFADADIDLYFLDKYEGPDIDERQIRVLLKQYFSEFAIKSNDYLVEVTFEKRRKLQFIKARRNTVDIHLRSCDLPCTQIAIQYDRIKQEYFADVTEDASFALQHNINLIDGVPNTRTLRRVVKYSKRRIYTFIRSTWKGRIQGILCVTYQFVFKLCVDFHVEKYMNNVNDHWVNLLRDDVRVFGYRMLGHSREKDAEEEETYGTLMLDL